MKEKVKQLLSGKDKLVFLSCLLSGIILHGAILFSNFSYRDDVTYHFTLGETFSSLRWSLGIYERIRDCLHVGTFSLNAWNGTWSLIWIAISAVIVVRLLDISDTFLSILIGISMVAFPVVTSTFAYMFTAHCYFFALFLMTLAIYSADKYRYGWIVAVAMISVGTGIYQAYFVYAAALAWAKIICDFWKSDENRVRKSSIKIIVALILGVALYLVLSKIFVAYQNVEVNDYQGMAQGLNSVDVSNIGYALFRTYKAFFRLAIWDVCGLSNSTSIRAAYKILYALIAILLLIIGWENRNKIKKMIAWVGMLFLFPFSVSAIWLLQYAGGGAFVHTLMLYSYIMVLILPIALIGQIKNETHIKRILYTVLGMTVLLIVGYNGWLDNAAYEKASRLQESANAYCTELISNIRNTEGYCDELPIAFVYDENAIDDTIQPLWQYNEITLQGYSIRGNQFNAFATFPEYMSLHCGFKYDTPDNYSEICESEEVKEMPVYPDYGSIKVIDDVVVVKLVGIKQEL